MGEAEQAQAKEQEARVDGSLRTGPDEDGAGAQVLLGGKVIGEAEDGQQDGQAGEPQGAEGDQAPVDQVEIGHRTGDYSLFNSGAYGLFGG